MYTRAFSFLLQLNFVREDLYDEDKPGELMTSGAFAISLYLICIGFTWTISDLHQLDFALICDCGVLAFKSTSAA